MALRATIEGSGWHQERPADDVDLASDEFLCSCLAEREVGGLAIVIGEFMLRGLTWVRRTGRISPSA